MGDLYGRAFFENYGDTPNKAWREMLGTMDFETVSRGLERCATEQEWVPSLPRFFELCRKPVTQAAHLPAPKGLPKLPDREAVKDARNELRKAAGLPPMEEGK